jgi:flagellar biosynthetic protein FliO
MEKGCWLTLIVSLFLSFPVLAGDEATMVSSVTAVQTATSALVTKPAGFQSLRLGEAYDRIAGNNPLHPSTQNKSTDLPPSTQGLWRVLIQIVVSLAVVVVVIIGISWLMRKWGGGSFLTTTGPLKVLSRQNLSNKSSLYVVSALDRFLIIGETSQGLSCLSEFSDSEENRRLRDKWGWEGQTPTANEDLYTPETSPFGPTLRSHVEELQKELTRFQGKTP